MKSKGGASPCRVVMFQRRPLAGQQSIERVFADVRNALPPDISVTTHILPCESRGVKNRIHNIFFAWRNRGPINHVTGDVHYLALGLPGRSTILTVHDLVSLGRLSGIRRTVLALFWYWLPVRRVRFVTTVSEWTRDELIQLLPFAAPKAVVVHNPVSPIFQASPLRYRHHPVVLQVGTGANKNLARVVEALRDLPVHLRIVGHLNSQQCAQLSAAQMDFSQICGITDEEMAREYSNCYLLLFPSTYEGFGLPILEAQASGRPVVTSSVASMPEVAGGAAMLVDPLDVTEIRRALQFLIDDQQLYQSLVERGLENAQRYTAISVAASYATIYRKFHRRP